MKHIRHVALMMYVAFCIGGGFLHATAADPETAASPNQDALGSSGGTLNIVMPERLNHPTAAMSFMYEIQPFDKITLMPGDTRAFQSVGMTAEWFPLTGPFGEFSLLFNGAMCWKPGISPSYVIPLMFGGMYKFLYWREQFLVPYVAGGYGRTLYTVDAPYGASNLTGGVNQPWYDIGGMLLLNALEQSSASKLYASTGIRRTYIVLDYMSRLSATRDSMDFTSKALRLALRFEI